MNARKIIGTGVMALALVGAGALVASAQVVGTPSGSSVMVTTTPVTTSPGPGTNGATLASIQISGVSGANYSLTSIPITVTPSSGAAASDLSECQIVNSSGSALNSGNNLTGSLNAGTNTITFDNPLVIDGGAGASTYTLRCNVSSGALSNATYQLIAGDPTYTSTATAASPGSLGISLNMIPTAPSGTSNAVLGIIGLDASNSGSAVTVSSVPVTLSFNGNAPADFTDCALRSASALGIALNTGVNAISSINTAGATTFTLDTPMSIPAGSTELVALTCNVAAGTPTGSTVNASIDPALVAATGATGTVTPVTDVSASTGVASPTSGTTTITAPSAVTTTTTGTTGTTGTPGAPNTGAGGNAASNFALLALAAIAAIAGSAILLRSGLFSLER